jgi:4-diphosphocytidyl-2-C-methyl-D-erythritol kinase
LKQTIRLRAFAKINLGLKILARRPDGYHAIRTVFQTIELHDRLEVSLSSGTRGLAVECDDPAVPEGRGNLVYRACEGWRRARHFRGGIRVRIHKAIPAGSGLGGASSDAAATVLGLERLTGDRLGSAVRFRLAARLGSDVPFFLLGGRALGCGRGEELFPLEDLPARMCLVVFPGFSVATAEAYREASRLLTKTREVRSMERFGAWPQHPLSSWGPAENDFERVVFTWWPELGRVKQQLIQAGAETASLTGSGSALFATFKSARRLVRTSKLIPAGWLSFCTRTISRAAYQRLLFGTVTSDK